MLINRRNLLPLVAAAPKAGRYAMDGLSFGRHGTAGTDGKRLMWVSYPDGLDPADFPSMPGMAEDAPAAEIDEPFVLSTEAAKSFGKQPKCEKPILEAIAVKAGENGTVQFGWTDLETAHTPTVRKMEGGFPRIDTVCPRAGDLCDYTHVPVNPEYLAEMLKAHVRLAPRDGLVVHLFVPKKRGAPMVLRSKVEGQQAFSVLMPVTAEHEWCFALPTPADLGERSEYPKSKEGAR